jgi:hypothetical protein
MDVNVMGIDYTSRRQIDGEVTHTKIADTTTTEQAIAANENRRGLLLVNDSDTAMYIRLGTADAVVNEGIRLNANGGSIEFSAWNGVNYLGAVQVISGGAKVLLVTEW